jgi:hypothetical protein
LGNTYYTIFIFLINTHMLTNIYLTTYKYIIIHTRWTGKRKNWISLSEYTEQQVNIYSPNGHVIIRRRTDNWMTKIIKTTRQTMMHKILHRKLKIGQHEPHKKPRINNTKYYTESIKLGNTNHTPNLQFSV